MSAADLRSPNIPGTSITPSITNIPSSSNSMTSLHTLDNEANTRKSTLILREFPFSLILEITTSEPRDVLQSERTTLVFVRFATSLFFTALGIMYNFKLQTANTNDGSDDAAAISRYTERKRSLFSTIVSYLLIALALATLIVSSINYFITIRHYADHKIYTYNFNNFPTMIIMTSVILTLIGICVALIVESMLQES